MHGNGINGMVLVVRQLFSNMEFHIVKSVGRLLDIMQDQTPDAFGQGQSQ